MAYASSAACSKGAVSLPGRAPVALSPAFNCDNNPSSSRGDPAHRAAARSTSFWLSRIDSRDRKCRSSLRRLSSPGSRISTHAPPCSRFTSRFDSPAIAPGINALEFGGLTYYEVSNLLRGIAAKGKIVGFDVVEIAPGKDHQNITSLLAARLTLNLLGAMAHGGQIGSDTTRWA